MSRFLFIICFLISCQLVIGQRNYVPSSVLASGDWYKISINREGIYKIDYHFLRQLGVDVNRLSSSSIRLYGNGGAMLPEKVSYQTPDDLLENAIQVSDGGDGVFNEGDYFLFYAPGPDRWLKDSLNQRFIHEQNLYSDQCFYFLSIGGTGKRIPVTSSTGMATVEVDSYNERYHYEPDSVNLLSSGKEWFSAELSNAAGRQASRIFSIPIDNFLPAPQATIICRSLARSIGSPALFSIKVNQSLLMQQQIDAVTSGSYDVFAKAEESIGTFQPSTPLVLQYDFSSGGFGASGWLDWFEIFARRRLVMTPGKPLFFRDWNSVTNNGVAAFHISAVPANLQVWEVTDAFNVRKCDGTYSAGGFIFKNDSRILREYVAFGNEYQVPKPVGKIKNQDIHLALGHQMLIVTHPAFLSQAERLAKFHLDHDHLNSLVVTTEEVFNEFSSGSPDPTAIRNFAKMFYDKAAADSSMRPKYLLLFGDASYDYKNKAKGNSNLVPAYESNESLDPLGSYVSDDYFGFLDDNEDINNPAVLNLLDIGIGRVPARTGSQAKAFVDKVIAYKDTATLGSWRNEMAFIADDEDFNLHLQDAETVTDAARRANDLFNQHKLYLDAFPQESNASGSRYPLVNKALKERVEKGVLILNYSGHGGFRRLAEEVIIDQEEIDNWYNPGRLPLFITATCDFAPYDNPSIYSLGEDMLLRRETGAIALMTTTRLVFAYSNRLINQEYLQTALARKTDGSYLTLGEAVQDAKNNTYTSFSDIINNRKFTLLGDPALTLNFPSYSVNTIAINGKSSGTIPDTIKAFEEVTLEGAVMNGSSLFTSFSGKVDVEVFDKADSKTTLANDPSSLKQNFQVQEQLLFKGTATVTAGKFTARFSVPKDINYKAGNGRISYYASNGNVDANGSFTDFIIGGSAAAVADQEGPALQGWLEDFSFKNGATVSDAPLLIVKLTDNSGINNTGVAHGHEISAVPDGDVKNKIVLNDWLQIKENGYQEGMIRMRLPLLKEGKHELVIKAWDNANNSSSLLLQFQVKKARQVIDDIVNYPNPTTGSTRFCISQNSPGEKSRVTINIFTPHGQLIKSLQRTINTPANRSCDIEWDGLDARGRKANRGIYIYNVEIETADGAKANKSKKLIVI